MRTSKLSRAEQKLINETVEAYKTHQPAISLFQNQLLLALNGASKLTPLVHSIRSRLKDSTHLQDKLERKLSRCKGESKPFNITPENLLTTINDLVGVRILHLYTRQIEAIDAALREILAENQYTLIEGPFARTWDNESRDFFRNCKIETQDSASLYTSVHYVIGSASRTKVTAEIQVRTLMEEVWGEVDHKMNYPHPAASLPCREQLKVLARVTSSATRLVDSIFLTLGDHATANQASVTKPKRRPKK
ncbi:hypothetical protein OWM54_04315 [Myxococcus sp. MISCRS1]|uniref:hypothetical protein n=1 Tax=Myxococcus sp. MISCRS1 TaxID=2996786 RepID=UPI002271BE1D|nr:hypothetical protein [Myxococcus sp. MISCRS1]MCY0996353.1 hypothetical protein [Myxococcus sp. MISCRS1]